MADLNQLNPTPLNVATASKVSPTPQAVPPPVPNGATGQPPAQATPGHTPGDGTQTATPHKGDAPSRPSNIVLNPKGGRNG